MGTSWSVFPVEETQAMEQEYNRKEEEKEEGEEKEKKKEEKELSSVIGDHLVLVFRFNGENDFELVRQKWCTKDPFV